MMLVHCGVSLLQTQTRASSHITVHTLNPRPPYQTPCHLPIGTCSSIPLVRTSISLCGAHQQLCAAEHPSHQPIRMIICRHPDVELPGAYIHGAQNPAHRQVLINVCRRKGRVLHPRLELGVAVAEREASRNRQHVVPDLARWRVRNGCNDALATVCEGLEVDGEVNCCLVCGAVAARDRREGERGRDRKGERERESEWESERDERRGQRKGERGLTSTQ